jgi:hypothetical protein
MMDFLRRLAPPRETDATRAVAVLTSRFASESPLRETIGQAWPAQRPDDDTSLSLDGASLSFDTTSPPAATNALAAQRHPVTGVQPTHAAPRPLGIEPTRRDNGKATSPTHAPAEAPNTDIADPRASQDPHGENSERAKPAGPELQGLATALAASHGPRSVAAVPASPRLQGVAAPPPQPRVALPLSQAILAQRTLQFRDDGQVVHVTIGRIDVVANTAPASAVRRSPAPRQATVTLADYLRGGNGSRR